MTTEKELNLRERMIERYKMAWGEIPYPMENKVNLMLVDTIKEARKETIEEIENIVGNEEVTTEEEYIFKKIILQRLFELKEKQ